MIFFKDYSFLVIELFLAKQHFIKDFPQRFLAVGYPKRFRLTPNDPCPPCAPWIIRASSVDKFFRNILMFYTEKCVPLYATREMMTRGSLRKPSKIRIYMMPVNNNMAPSPQPVIANDSIK